MERSIQLNRNSPAAIAYLRGKNACADHLHIVGKGTLFVCLLAFYNEGDHPARHRELYFYNPAYVSSKKLPAKVSGFNISEYDYCAISILTGSAEPGDEIYLRYKIIPGELDATKPIR
jgi:hypothetical protein